ncbi:Ulp1 protease family, carboxy-terminal domain protein [Arachis hypogaea]|nr:Ulp1 protease family, carboxy-terminal domain protein [Arachis hypogaea]
MQLPQQLETTLTISQFRHRHLVHKAALSTSSAKTNRGVLDRPLPQRDKPQGEGGNCLSPEHFLGWVGAREKRHASLAVQYAEQQNFLQIRHVDRSQWGKEIGKNIPRGMPLTFFPTKDMKIVGLDLCVAAYIFNTKLDQDELLVQSPHCAITRGTLRTLEPRKPVVDDVLILLACMLARNSTRIHWFLPTTFSQIATGRGSIPHATLKAIREDFMGKANRVCKKITEYSRMRLAVDMVLKYHNDKRMEVIQAVLEYWRNLTTNSPATN